MDTCTSRESSAIQRYLAAHQLPQEHALLRLDGQYGTGAALSDLAGFSYVTRGKDYALLDRPEVQVEQSLSASSDLAPVPLSRAHYRLD